MSEEGDRKHALWAQLRSKPKAKQVKCKVPFSVRHSCAQQQARAKLLQSQEACAGLW